MPTDASRVPHLVRITAPPRPLPSGASTPNGSDASSSRDHLAFSGDQPRSADSAMHCFRSPGTRRRMGGNDLLSLSETTVPEATAIAGRRQRPLREQRREARERARAFPLVERHQLMLEAAALTVAF